MNIATTKLSSRGQIVIPSAMRNGFNEGDTLVLIRKGEDIILRKEQKAVDVLAEVDFDWSDTPYFADDQALHEIWSSKEEDEAWKDL